MLYRGLPAAVRGFEAEHPGMEVVLQEMNSAEQALALQRGQIDIGFIHRGPWRQGCAPRHCWPNPSSAACRPGTLAGAERIDLAELREDPFILFPPRRPHYHDLIIACCVGAGFSPQIRHEARLWQTIVAMVAQGMGVALLPASLCRAWPGVVGVPWSRKAHCRKSMSCSARRTPRGGTRLPRTPATATGGRRYGFRYRAIRTNDY